MPRRGDRQGPMGRDLCSSMARKRTLKQFSKKELLEDLARRHADEKFHDGMTMSEMELAAEELKGETGEPVRGADAVPDDASGAQALEGADSAHCFPTYPAPATS